MKYQRLTAVLISCAVVIGCEEQAAPTEALSPEFVVAGESGCYTVKFTDDMVWTPSVGGYLGQLAGDLEGTMTEWDQGQMAVKIVGGTIKVDEITSTFNITGGIIPELEGQSFAVAWDFQNLFKADPENYINLGKVRAIDGVAKANLTFRGYTPMDGLWSYIDFQGVICP